MRGMAVIIIFLVLIAGSAGAEPFFLVNGGGSGGDNDASSFGLVFGGTTAIAAQVPLALELSMSDTENYPEAVFEQPAPPGTTLVTSRHNKHSELGLVLRSGYTIGDFSLIAGGGCAWQVKAVVGREPQTGALFEQSDETVWYGTYYGGVQYRLGRLVLEAGYDRRRGPTGGLGFTWQ